MTTSSTTTAQIPGLVAGTWAIDPVHSEVSFSVRHMMVSKVRGHFTTFEGQIQVGEDLLASSVNVTIDMSSIDTREENRDNHLRSGDFFDTATHPTATYRSTGVRSDGDLYVLDGELTLRGTTRPVSLTVEANGVHPDMSGGTRAGFSATAEISRKDFGVDISMPLDGGGVVVGDAIHLTLEVEAILQEDDGT